MAMLIQRVREAEIRTENKPPNGPLRVQSNLPWQRVFCNVSTYVSCQGYDRILQSAQLIPVNQGGIADNLKLFVLDR